MILSPLVIVLSHINKRSPYSLSFPTFPLFSASLTPVDLLFWMNAAYPCPSLAAEDTAQVQPHLSCCGPNSQCFWAQQKPPRASSPDARASPHPNNPGPRTCVFGFRMKKPAHLSSPENKGSLGPSRQRFQNLTLQPPVSRRMQLCINEPSLFMQRGFGGWGEA